MGPVGTLTIKINILPVEIARGNSTKGLKHDTLFLSSKEYVKNIRTEYKFRRKVYKLGLLWIAFKHVCCIQLAKIM